MATDKQIKAAKQNIKKAQAKWRQMSPRQHSLAQPEGRGRSKPGTKGTGDFYRIVVRDKSEFTSFRTHDVGEKGHLQRVTGRRSSGSWATQAWLVSKKDAHIKGNQLIPESDDAKELFGQLQTVPTQVKGDVFEARDRRNVPEREKPTKSQQKAQQQNIKKARAARHKKK